MDIKSAASRVGHGILDGLSAIHDASVRSQIEELDKQAQALTAQITDIQEKKAELKKQLD